MSEKNNGENITSALIDVIMQEHNIRRQSIMGVINTIKEKMENAEDDIEENIMIEQFNDVLASSVKNDSNIVKLIELVLKYEHDGSKEEVDKIKEYKTKLSDNSLDITFKD